MLLFFVVTYFEGAVQWTGVLVLLRFRRAGSQSSQKKEELVQKKGSKVPGLSWYVLGMKTVRIFFDRIRDRIR
jgi:hypothetical protein